MDCFAGTCQAELKSALVACGRGRSGRNTLCVSPAGPAAATVNLTLEPISHDGDPAVRLSVERQIQPDRAKTPAELVEQSLHTDIATGFLQRRQFLDLLGEQAESQNTERCRVLAFVQPDRFDEIESDLGPVSSEEIIGQIAAVLDKLMDESDLGGRYSGNVLGLVLERDNLRDVETWTEYALGRISERVFEVADRTLSLTCSFGLVEIGSVPERVEDLIRNGERALERARDEGGNCKSIEETADESTRIRRIDEIRVRQIRSALVDGRFRLMHLNVASLAGKSERIFDTFVRLVDEQGDEIAATEFMESAARNNMLRPVDRWVLDATLDFCAREASDVVFIKLSHESILDESLLSWVAERTGAAKIAPGRICFQVTEDDASKYQKQTGLLAQQLQSRGFRFAVEKFGMGRDPLRVLQTTPMDFVKFDGSLSQLLGQNSPIQEKLRGLVAAAKTQDIRTIATQVENANTMTLLFQLGVGYMQGHYLHEPEVVLEAAV
jgi:diguanylate cyclase (GGDEF)-like protein